MRLDKITVAGAILAIMAVSSAAAFISQNPFQPFVYAPPPDHFIDVSQDVGVEDSRFMWSYRVTDLMAQALAIFAASVACLAMLGLAEKREVP